MHPILLLSVVVILFPAAPPVSPGQSLPGAGIAMSVDCPGTPGTCAFGVSVLDPGLLFFRWDFEGDGVWDFPSNDGWSTEVTVAYSYAAGGPHTACVQAWDGVAAWTADGRLKFGPVTCLPLLLGGDFSLTPPSWDGAFAGTVLAAWAVPATFVPDASAPESVTIGGVPAITMRVLGRPTQPFVALFVVNRAALSAMLGPGTHYVRLSGVWNSSSFSVWGGVHFFADGQVTIS